MQMRKRPFLLLYRALLVSFCLSCFIPCPAFAQDTQSILLLPFEVYSKANREVLQETFRSALAAELQRSKSVRLVPAEQMMKTYSGKRIDEATALILGKEGGADFVILGSLTEFGESFSADVRMMNVKEAKALPGFSVLGRGKEGIGTVASRLRGEILLRVGVEHKIARVEIKGNRKIESVAISQALKSSTGRLFSETDISEDIKSIYKMGYFQDVKADVTIVPEGKIVTFIVEEKALISEIAIKGNKAIDMDDIRAVMTVKPRQILNPEKLAGDIEKIKALYEGKGYYNAEIQYAVEKEGEKDSKVVLVVTENSRIYIERISFEGNQAFRDKELKNMMKTSEWDILHFITDSGLLKKDELKQDIGKLYIFYHNNGFINAQIGEPQFTYDKKGIYIKIPITEGRQFRVGKIDITGDPLKVTKPEVMGQLEIKKKDNYDRSSVIRDVEYLTKLANDEGYAYVDVTPRVNTNEKEQTVDVDYHVTKGNLVYFNRISFMGNTKTRDKVMRRNLRIVEGELYNSTKLKDSYKNLEKLRYFEEVNFQTEKGPDDTLTDVMIQVKEKPTGMFSLGAGYSALDGATAMGEISQQNLFGRGQILKLKAQVSSSRQWYELEFVEPWLFDIPLWGKFGLWNSAKTYDWYNFYSSGVGMTLAYPIWHNMTLSGGYKFASNAITDMSPYAPDYLKSQGGSSTASVLSLGISRDTTDDNFFPTKGTRAGISIGYAGGPLGGTESFTQYGANTAWFYSLPLESVFIIKGMGGYLAANGEKPIPLYMNYVLGGMNTLRGLRDVGPTDPASGYVIGGKTMLVFNAEIVFPLVKNAGMKGVVFYDMGNTWESGYYIDDLRKTAGLGIRWYSPIGPLRLEWGYVLDRKENESVYRWEFAIGMFM